MLNDIPLRAGYGDTAHQSKPHQTFSLYCREPGKAGHMQTLLSDDSSKALGPVSCQLKFIASPLALC